MRIIQLALVVLLFPLVTASTSDHKFYVSITKVEFNQESESVQMITKIFIDDLEAVLRERYNTNLTLGEDETEQTGKLVDRYILEKFHVVANDNDVPMEFIGKEYDIDMVKVYIEIPNVEALDRIEVESKLLFDKFQEQQNIIHVKVGRKRKSLILDIENPKGVLNFQ